MKTSKSLKEFLRQPTASDKLRLFRMLFDARELNTDLALALLKVIHSELGREQERDRTTYKRYDETIANLRYHKADMLRQVVKAWNAGRTDKEPEWLSDGMIK
ncbi:MAG: hypothetical protein HXY38_07305 [Chloroflexi bacterium]|nr:hypothetical protein [Chloroflexota bacterium]